MRMSKVQELILALAGSRSGQERPPFLLGKFEAIRGDHSWFPDEEETIIAICREIDEESNPDVAWSLVWDIESVKLSHGLAEGDQLRQAVAFSISDSTLAYVDNKTGKTASGILVNVGSKVFLATTSHSLPTKPNGRLSIVCSTPYSVYRDFSCFIDSAKRDYRQTGWDVGYLELAPDFVAEKTGKIPISLERVMPCGPGYEDRLTCVAGYPSSMVSEIEPTDDSVTKVFNAHCWWNKILPSRSWGSLGSCSRPADESMDVFIPYPRDEDFRTIGSFKQDSIFELAEPFGMSGGGYWQPKLELKREVFSPDYYAIIAIQSHWWGKGRYLQGTQIVHWLRLLSDKRPDVRSELLDRFPACALDYGAPE